jgi:hypothetical protein
MTIRRITIALFFVFAPSLTFTQSPRGTITGTITDSQNARVPGVEVTALHVATGASAIRKHRAFKGPDHRITDSCPYQIVHSHSRGAASPN